jgi:type I restriction enzyme S subunit
MGSVMGNHKEFNQSEIGRIPKEWETVSLGDEKVCQIIMGQSPSSSTYNKIQEGLPFLQGNMEFGEIYPSPTIYCSEPIKIAEKNDVLISVRAPVGELNISPSRVCIGRGLAAIRCKPNKTNDLFLFYYLKYIAKKFEAISAGSTFKAIRKNDLDQLEIILPPLPEQKKIAEILSTVDQAIEKVGEAIEKTHRMKKGLMRKLLTNGIGHKEFKDTEIGRIPKEWEVMMLGETANVRYGLGQPPALETNGIPMIRATNVKRGKIVREGLIFINPNAIPNSRDPFLRVGDILVVRSGAYTGDVALVTKEWEGAIAGYDLIVKPSRSLDSQFLTYYLLSPPVQKEHFVGLKVRSAQPHLNSSQVEETPIPLPSLPEQQKIAEILSTVDKRLESFRNRKEKLHRVKRGLMNDLLTGQKRVKLN